MKENLNTPELREVVKDNDRKIYNFSYHMVEDEELVDALVVSTFTEFGSVYRKFVTKKRAEWTAEELRIRLFKLNWKHIKNSLTEYEHVLTVGRDTRQMKGLDDNLLGQPHTTPVLKDQFPDQIFERLLNIDPDFRAPLVLRDILKFRDEQVTQILGIRWGVYRHRLNRARLDLRDYLRGRSYIALSRGAQKSDLSV